MSDKQETFEEALPELTLDVHNTAISWHEGDIDQASYERFAKENDAAILAAHNAALERAVAQAREDERLAVAEFLHEVIPGTPYEAALALARRDIDALRKLAQPEGEKR